MELSVPIITPDDLRNFHTTHFPGQPFPPLPTDFTQDAADDVNEVYEDYDDGLGYYEDGVKRTLTDAEIAYMRNREIREIFEERRRRKYGDQSMEPEALKPDTATQVSEKASDGENAATTPSSASAPRSQWTQVSQKTRSKSKRKNMKQRRLKRERIQEQKKQKREQDSKDDKYDENEESDEWDPWHQAKGPDVQKDSPVIDLDY